MLNEREIMANEILGKNDWEKISEQNLTEQQLREWKDKLYWYKVFINSQVPEDLIEELEKEGKLNDLEWKRISKHQNLSEKFLVKHNNKIHLFFILKRYKFPLKFIANNLLKTKPEIGMGAIVACGSDCYPYTIIEINKTGTKIKIQEDNSHRLPGFDYYSDQKYDYSPNPNGITHNISLRKDGVWRIVNSNQRISIGHRRRYEDPSF